MAFTSFYDMKPFSQLMFAIFIMIASAIIFIVLGIIAAMPFIDVELLLAAISEAQNSTADNIAFLKYFQLLQSVGFFVIPPFILAWLYSGRIVDYLYLDKSASNKSYLLASVLIIAILPFISYLGFLNSQMSFPESLAGVENWMKNMENTAEALVKLFMNVDSVGGLLFNIFLIAVIPAIGEELLFRGVIQKIFFNWTKNNNWAIWITAILFSAMHMQFFGFIPRMILGALFGYLLVWSGSMWIPILAHFINNTIGVIMYYLMNKGVVDPKIEDLGSEPGQLPIVIISLISALFIVYYFQKIESNKTKMPVNHEDSQAPRID